MAKRGRKWLKGAKNGQNGPQFNVRLHYCSPLAAIPIYLYSCIFIYFIIYLKQIVQATNMSIHGILGFLYLEIQGLKCDFSHPKKFFFPSMLHFTENTKGMVKQIYRIYKRMSGAHMFAFSKVRSLYVGYQGVPK